MHSNNAITKTIAHLKAGDIVAGHDNIPKVISSIGKDRAKMYKIFQSNGYCYFVSKNHPLCLARYKDGKYEFTEIPFIDYFSSKELRNEWYGYSVKASCTLKWRRGEPLIPGEVKVLKLSILTYEELGNNICYRIEFQSGDKFVIQGNTVCHC